MKYLITLYVSVFFCFSCFGQTASQFFKLIDSQDKIISAENKNTQNKANTSKTASTSKPKINSDQESLNRWEQHNKQPKNKKTISSFIKTFESDLNRMPSYRNQTAAYRSNQDYDKAWKKVHKTESRGYEVIPNF
ncbi:MAG: hypothetical protein GY858_01800 [Candidatus Omnitrophica bacterium]|nr:hypothetical protein [Candidatus Omnitrophota bacterium]